MSAFRLYLALAFMVAVGAPSVRAQTSPADQIPAASIIVVKQRLPVAPEYTWVFVQFGKVVSWDRLAQWYPFCRFELKGRAAMERHVEPGRYRVTRAVGERRTTELDGPGIRRARNIMVQGGGAPDIIFRSHFELVSADHPEVRRLSCEEKFVMMDMQSGFMSLAKIREALGELAAVEPAR